MERQAVIDEVYEMIGYDWISFPVLLDRPNTNRGPDDPKYDNNRLAIALFELVASCKIHKREMPSSWYPYIEWVREYSRGGDPGSEKSNSPLPSSLKNLVGVR